ncbi:MAG: hypothetical protein ACREQM_07930, partial [Candidatus Dormibacteraceae bacterium]
MPEQYPHHCRSKPERFHRHWSPVAQVPEKQVRPGTGAPGDGVRSEFHGWWRDIDGFTDNPSGGASSSVSLR